MNFDNFTIKSQEALQAATQEAMNNGQQAIETGHVLKGVLNVDENVTPFLLKKLGVNVQAFQVVTLIPILLQMVTTQQMLRLAGSMVLPLLQHNYI